SGLAERMLNVIELCKSARRPFGRALAQPLRHDTATAPALGQSRRGCQELNAPGRRCQHGRADEMPQRCRHAARAPPALERAWIAGVAAEELISRIAREGYGDVAACDFADKVGWNLRGVAEGFIVDLRQ